MKSIQFSGLLFLAISILFGCWLPGQAAAADVNKLFTECAECHGKNGASKDKDVPIIGGLSSAYIVQTMGFYKEKKRPCPEIKYREGPKKGQNTNMCDVAKNLGSDDTRQLADFLAGQKFVRAQQTADAALAKKGAEIHEHKCEKCHSNSGSEPADDSGILAGQWMPYLAETLKDYKEGKRPMDKKMKPKIDGLKQPDIDALVQYYGSLK